MRQPSGQEKRGHPRYPLTGEVRGRELSRLGAPKARKRLIRGPIQNISSGGLCLLTDQVIKVSSLIRCELLFSQIPAPIPTLLQVRWAQKARKGTGCTAGLQFLL